MNPYTGKLVTEANKKQHEKWRCNYDAMKHLLENHFDYQVKPVISNKNELEEFRALQKILSVPNDKVYLMPEGLNREQLRRRRQWLSEVAVEMGYNFTDRLHIITYGDKRGV
jgi:organic radical activating enzyme